MPTGGTLTVHTETIDVDVARAEEIGVRPGRYAALIVSDTGVGMDEDVAVHAFDPFFTTKEEGKGSGLGLSTVYGIAKRAGGAVILSTKPAQGARFTVLFPSAAARPPAPPAAQNGEALGGTETILLVEDQPALRAIVSTILSTAGYTVLEAGSAEEALRASEAYAAPIHLLLTDVVMPITTGPQLALRLIGARPSLRVLYMSGHSEETLGGEVLQKPFSPEALLVRLREALQEP